MAEQNTNAAPAIKSALVRFWRHLGRQLHDYRDEFQVMGFVLILLILFLLPLMIYTVPPGHVGVHWKRFGGGTDLNRVYAEGTRFIMPWDLMFIYDARLQMVGKPGDALSVDGLQMTFDVAMRFRLLPEAAGEVHKYLGQNYLETLIAPTVAARARDVVAMYDTTQIYTTKRLIIQEEILESVRYDLKTRFDFAGKLHNDWFVIEDILIKNITLPIGVQDAIVRKIATYQEMEEFSIRIEREQKESERKRIEAIGIRNFQEIVSNGMTEEYLRWRGIEATLELARSPNAKIVIIGSGEHGLPVILNATDSPIRIDERTGGATTPSAGAKAASSLPAPDQGAARPPKVQTGDKEETRSPPSDAARPEGGPAAREQDTQKPAAAKGK